MTLWLSSMLIGIRVSVRCFVILCPELTYSQHRDLESVASDYRNRRSDDARLYGYFYSWCASFTLGISNSHILSLGMIAVSAHILWRDLSFERKKIVSRQEASGTPQPIHVSC